MPIPPEILYGICALLIAGAIIWAMMRNRQRTAHEKAVTEEATREKYKHPDT